MSALTTLLREKSIFELLGLSVDGDAQEEDLKEAELGTLGQFVANLRLDAANGEVAGKVESLLNELNSAQGETYTTLLDGLYTYLNDQFAGDLTARLESAVDQFKRDILAERMVFLKEKMQQHVDRYFTKAEELHKNEDLATLLSYLNEIQEYLKSTPSEA